MTTQGKTTSPAQRALILASVDALVRSGSSLRRACLEMGINHNTWYRWSADAAPLQEPRSSAKRGRQSKFDLSHAEARRLRFWRLVKGSVPLAVESAIAEALQADDSAYFSALRAALGDTGTGPETARLRPDLALAMRRHWEAAVNARKPVVWPQSIARACRVTAQEEAEFRGKKHASDARGTERRGTMIRTEEGDLIPWYAGAIWESDDMSLNDPFRFHDAAAGREMLGRQMLATIDSYSLHWLGASHIGRDRDSYRAEDIASHFREIVEAHGLPLIWRIERGRWDNNFIWGCPIGKSEDGQEQRWGGLDRIIHMREKFTSQGKANVEGSFNLLQSLMDHGFNGQTLSIGRERGEFETATRHLLRAGRGDESSLGRFWSIAQSADAVRQAMHLFNSRPKQRQGWNNQTCVPAELWAGHQRRECPRDQMWRFHAVKTTARVKRGLLEVKAPHYPLPFRFRIHGGSRTSRLHLDDGHELLIAFTPSQAWEGCEIFNADRSARNREGWGFAQHIGTAEHMADALQEDLHSTSYAPGQVRAAAQVRKETRLLTSGTAFARRISHAQDGHGASLRTVAGALPAADRIAPAATERSHTPFARSSLTPDPVLDEDDELAALSL
jgi:hypothetical protein